MKRIILIAMTFLVVSQIQAQSQKVISGLVTKGSYEPVPNYPITVIDSSSSPSQSVAVYNYVTNSQGRFTDTIITQGSIGRLIYSSPDSCGFAINQLSYGSNTPFNMATCAVVLCNTNITITSNHQEADNLLDISFFPNPVNKELYVNIPDNISTDFNLTIVDIHGKLLLTETRTQEKLSTIDLSQLPAGVYFLMVSSGDLTYQAKIVKN
jgi:hypothetical protein